MTTIEDKVKLFSQIINKKTQQEFQKKFEEFETQKKLLIENRMRELEEERKLLLQQAAKKVQLRCNEIISKDKFENNSAVLELKKSFINETINELRSRLSTFTKSSEYKNFLIDLTDKLIGNIEKGDYIIFISEDDKSKYGKLLESKLSMYEGKNFTIEASNEDIIGGIIVQDRLGKFRLNVSFASKLEECTEIIGVRISEKVG